MYCRVCNAAGARQAPGSGDAGSIQPAKMKVVCARTGGGCGLNTVTFDGDRMLGDMLPTRGDVWQASRSDSAFLPGRCFNPDCTAGGAAAGGESRRANTVVYFQCNGSDGGEVCHARSDEGDCSVMIQLVEADEECSILLDAPDDRRLFRFDPCGCHISVEAFVMNVRTLVEGGEARGRIAESPITGQYAFECPTCEGSFVHDVSQYRCCGDREYRLIKEWGAAVHAPDGDADAADAERRRREQERRDEQRRREEEQHLTEEQLRSMLTKPCPHPGCGITIQKDGGCDHMTCRACGHQYYWTTLAPYP